MRRVKTYCKAKSYRLWKVYSDIGSGLNDKRKGLQRLLKAAACEQFDVLVVSYNDRLARFGLQIIKEYLASWGVELDVRHPTMIENGSHSELITDLTAILYSFMEKLYRMRRTT
ncbi:MAG: recombinase family protein [Promethearchaeota archaeon]